MCETHAHRPFAGRTHHSRGCACPARLTQSVPTHAIRERRRPIAAVAHVERRPRVESWHGHEARCRPHPPLAWSCVPCPLPLLVLAHKDRERHRQTPLIPVSSAKAAGPCANRTHTAPLQAALTTRVVVRALPSPSARARAQRQREAPPNAAHPREPGEGCGAVCTAHAYSPFAGRTHHSRGRACPALSLCSCSRPETARGRAARRSSK